MACIGEALSLEEHGRLLREAGFHGVVLEDQSWALTGLMRELQRKVLLARMASKVGALALPGVDLALGQRLLSVAAEQVECGNLGYAIAVAS